VLVGYAGIFIILKTQGDYLRKEYQHMQICSENVCIFIRVGNYVTMYPYIFKNIHHRALSSAIGILNSALFVVVYLLLWYGRLA
jgi:hypothetical protein